MHLDPLGMRSSLKVIATLTRYPPADAVPAESSEPIEVLGVLVQKSAPANAVIINSGSYIWCGI